MSNENTISRRGLFMKMGILFNGLVLPRWPYRSCAFFCPQLLADARTPTFRGCPLDQSPNFRKVKRGWQRFEIPT